MLRCANASQPYLIALAGKSCSSLAEQRTLLLDYSLKGRFTQKKKKSYLLLVVRSHAYCERQTSILFSYRGIMDIYPKLPAWLDITRAGRKICIYII